MSMLCYAALMTSSILINNTIQLLFEHCHFMPLVFNLTYFIAPNVNSTDDVNTLDSFAFSF